MNKIFPKCFCLLTEAFFRLARPHKIEIFAHISLAISRLGVYGDVTSKNARGGLLMCTKEFGKESWFYKLITNTFATKVNFVQ